MRKLIVLGAAFALVGCGEAATEEPVAEEAAMEEVAAEKVVANSMDVTFEDGTSSTLFLYEDGTYAIGDATGTYMERDDGMTCYLGDEEGAEETCWGEAVENEDGSVTSTSDDGQVVTLSEATA